MKQVRLIRHGESAANAGEASLDHATIPMTLRGIEQAHLVARSIIQPPALIVASPFSRAQSTAMVTVAAFPSTPFETWPIHEFTYLEPARCINTTVAQRRGWVEAYWAQADPSLTDGDGAESFLDFMSRARSFLKRLEAHHACDFIAFSHGQFINAVAWLIERKPQQIDGRAMADWREYEILNHVPNCGGYTMTKAAADTHWRVSISMPEERGVACPNAGYQLPDDSPIYVEQRLQETISASSSNRGVADHSLNELSAREVSQILREVTFGRRRMIKVSDESWDEVYAGNFQVNIDGWHISIYKDCGDLDYCDQCRCPDGRRWSFNSGDRFGTDPIALLSTWEHQKVEEMLNQL